MNFKLPTLDKCKNFKMSGMKNLNFTLSQLLVAMILSNVFVYILSSEPEKTLTPLAPKVTSEGNIFIRLALKSMIPFTKGEKFTILNQDQKVLIHEAIWAQVIKKDENEEAGIYLVEIPKNLINQIPLLLKQELTAIPLIKSSIKKPTTIVRKDDENVEINF